MSVDALKAELGKLKMLVDGRKVSLWITPAAEGHLKLKPEDLIAVMASAFARSAGQLGRWSEPLVVWHHEDPDLLFVGTRLSGGEPYLFVAQTFADGPKLLRLMTAAFIDFNKR